jgi:hypothetical protein
MTSLESTTSDQEYRALFENPNEQVITLSHLFDALAEAGLKQELDDVLQKEGPLGVLVEGSTFPRNLDVVCDVLKNHNYQDCVTLVDISDDSIAKHTSHSAQLTETSNKAIKVIKADMNSVPLSNESVDLLINDCAINFNTTDEGNIKTLEEIHRLLKSPKSISLLSIIVDRKYDDLTYGDDQELVPEELLRLPGHFTSFKTLPDGQIELIEGTERKCWPVGYYERLLHEMGFDFVKFDIAKGKTYFPKESGLSYRRFMLRKR